MTPRLSVVVPAFRNAPFVETTVRSILDQDFGDFELIIADHGSDDGTWEVLDRIRDPRLALLRTEPGGGAPRNWNRVTAAATGEYLRLVCGDDLLLPGTLAAHVAALDAHPAAALAASPRRVIDARGGTLIASRGLEGLVAPLTGAETVRRGVRAGTNILGEPACVTVRRAALVGAGGWDGDWSYFIDAASYARVLEHGGVVPVPATGAAFRLSGGQWSVALARSQAAEAARFHAAMRERFPDAISGADVRLGNARARVLALARRAAYLVYARRMRA